MKNNAVPARTRRHRAAGQRSLLLRVLDALDPLDRAVVRELHVLRRSPAQAAAALGIPVSQVHRRANRAVRELSRWARELGSGAGSDTRPRGRTRV
ncbi:sigma factor-like helix-turn-helix DNA-binding protein [Streptomyces sp. NPDC050844]|uniref:sigma factor-like helix-turn-helix DNA-binding protein n=1 Tax=Streptomyces sp. NPDC050844 TaxID=3155790 RepID=UPI003411BD3F